MESFRFGGFGGEGEISGGGGGRFVEYLDGEKGRKREGERIDLLDR